MYSIILKTEDPMIFMERLNKMANNKLIELLKYNSSNKNIKFDISVFIDGIINLYIKYFRNEIDCSLDDIDSYSKFLFKKMFF